MASPEPQVQSIADANTHELTADDKAATELPDYIDLPSGSDLDASETLTITRVAPTHLIVLAGTADSGKTTLLASIYESLQEGPFADLYFAGSRSLVGFEQICHLNRLLSGQPTPDTERTKPSDQASYYHLSLLDLSQLSSSPMRHELLLSAVSGELFGLARDSTDEASNLIFLHRADVLAILIDGAKLVELDGREGAIADASGILQSLLDAGMLSQRVRVEFVFSKYDIIQKAGSTTESFLERAKTRLMQPFLSRLNSLSTRFIAARPVDSTLPFAFGVAEALRAWIADQELVEQPAWAKECPDSNQEFAQYGWRYFNREDRP